MTKPIENTRKPDHPVDKMFVERWSPRAFTGEEIPVETLMTILEAGRWAPSSYNSQPWRFAYARKGTPHFEAFLGLLSGMNPAWCANASALVFMASSETMNVPGKDQPVPSHTHSFDAGAAWMAAALQAHLMGWHAHGMIGIDLAAIPAKLKLPTGYRVEAAFAIGKRADPDGLPDAMKAREAPNDRKPLTETAAEGAFPG